MESNALYQVHIVQPVAGLPFIFFALELEHRPRVHLPASLLGLLLTLPSYVSLCQVFAACHPGRANAAFTGTTDLGYAVDRGQLLVQLSNKRTFER